MQRRREQARHEQRFGIGERVALGIEDVGVEDVRRRARQLVRDPRSTHVTISGSPAIVHRRRDMRSDLRIGHHRGQRDEQREGQRQKAGG